MDVPIRVNPHPDSGIVSTLCNFVIRAVVSWLTPSKEMRKIIRGINRPPVVPHLILALPKNRRLLVRYLFRRIYDPESERSDHA